MADSSDFEKQRQKEYEFLITRGRRAEKASAFQRALEFYTEATKIYQTPEIEDRIARIRGLMEKESGAAGSQERRRCPVHNEILDEMGRCPLEKRHDAQLERIKAGQEGYPVCEKCGREKREGAPGSYSFICPHCDAFTTQATSSWFDARRSMDQRRREREKREQEAYDAKVQRSEERKQKMKARWERSAPGRFLSTVRNEREEYEKGRREAEEAYEQDRFGALGVKSEEDIRVSIEGDRRSLTMELHELGGGPEEIQGWVVEKGKEAQNEFGRLREREAEIESTIRGKMTTNQREGLRKELGVISNQCRLWAGRLKKLEEIESGIESGQR